MKTQLKFLFTAIIVLVLLFGASGAVLAVHNDGLFQLDYTTSPAQGAANVSSTNISPAGNIETKYWRGNRATAIAAGLITGEYFWLYPDNVVSCSLQAKNYGSASRTCQNSYQ